MNIKTLVVVIAICMTASYNSVAQEPSKRSAKQIAYTAAYRERDSTKAVILGEKFLRDYPIAQTDAKADQAADIEYENIFVHLITAQKSQIEARIKQYYDVLTFYTVAQLAYRQVFLQNYHKLIPDSGLLERSRLLIDKIKFFQNHRPSQFANLTEEEWDKNYDDLYFRNVLTHINILRNTGNTKEGLVFADQAISRFGFGIASLNEDYVQLLNKDGQQEKAQKSLEASVNANQATPLMLSLLKQNYLTKHKDATGFEAYFESLKSAEENAELTEKLAAKMIKKEIPEFAMYDRNGKLVSTKDWKGKVVVLDFFASWCAPCKAAFPGMKMAQEKFVDSKDVIFYFIDTQETNKNYKEVVNKYMTDNDFPFNVLFDNEIQPGKNGAVARLLNVTAIPRKMILDKNGLVRFDSEGYFGSPTKLADEIKIMVELTKKLK